VADQTTRWQPDPYGAHELRFFSADGKPTLLVMDGGKTSYDRPPTTEPPPPPKPPSSLEPEPLPAPERPEPRQLPASVPPPILTPRPPGAHADHEATQSTARTPDADADSMVRYRPPAAVPGLTDFGEDRFAAGVDHNSQDPLSRPLKIAYAVVFVVLVVSALGFVYVQFHHTGGRHPTQADGTTTTASTSRTTTTMALPTALQPGAEAAATTLVSNWAAGNRTAALTVATQAAVTTLFAVPYASGQALDRGCSTSFIPIVCTFGPPGGASPTDPIYEIDVSQTAGGWYVSSVKIEN